jgi:hypothetical protein
MEETVLQDMADKLIEIGRRCGMGMNVEKTKAMRFHCFLPVQYFNYLFIFQLIALNCHFL